MDSKRSEIRNEYHPCFPNSNKIISSEVSFATSSRQWLKCYAFRNQTFIFCKISTFSCWYFCICCNLGQKICRLFQFLAQFFFTTCETELDYYDQKVSVRFASRVAERLKTYDLRKLGKFKKIPEMLGYDGEYPAV